MPFYEIHHSLTLTNSETGSLAKKITELHCTKFTTPAFFVHVKFTPQNPSTETPTYFIAGKAHLKAENRIIATVRVSSARSKTDFDELAAQIEKVWYEVVGGSIEDPEKRLIFVSFKPMISMRKGGMAIPEAGCEEGSLEERQGGWGWSTQQNGRRRQMP